MSQLVKAILILSYCILNPLYPWHYLTLNKWERSSDLTSTNKKVFAKAGHTEEQSAVNRYQLHPGWAHCWAFVC